MTAGGETPAAASSPHWRAELDTLSDEKSLVAFVQRERSALRERWSAARGGRAWVQEHTSLMDAIVRRLLTVAEQRSRLENPDADPGIGIAVAATGGYGQRTLAPGSDLDITVIAARDDDPPILRAFFTLVMDVLMAGNRIKVGYAFRTPADAEGGALDHHTQTALLDLRYIAGDGNLFARFDRLFHENLQVSEFLFRKEGEREERRARYGGSPFVTEPDIKNGPGGMRDWQTAAWMANVRFRRPGEALWRDLVRRKVITREDLHNFMEARELLLAVRCALHFTAGERRDLLSRQRQEEVALRLGFSRVTEFQDRYYTAAAHIAHLSDKVVTRCMDAPIPLSDSGLSAVRRRVVITEPARLGEDPLWPLVALRHCQGHNLEMAVATDEAVSRFLEENPWENPETRRAAGQTFLNLLIAPGDVGATLRRMRTVGLLKALLPELEACMGLVPFDPTHIYTVGEHTLCVLDQAVGLRESVTDDHPQLGNYRAIFKSLDSPLPLFLGALLHDVGKQWPTLLSGSPAKHEVTGAERVPHICERLGCPADVTATVTFLVRQHLMLAETSRLRDLGRAETVREVARAMGDTERLRLLYLLTYCDTSAVGPGVFSEMNARLLDELYGRTEEMLVRTEHAAPPPDAAERDGALDSVRERLRRRLAREKSNPSGVTAEAVREHIEKMPSAYLLNTPLEAMSTHLAMVDRLRSGEVVAVEARTLPGMGLTELTVVTYDDPVPGLLAKITGALLVCDVGIHTAQVFTREAGRGEQLAMDTLTVDFRGRALSVEKREEVESALRQVLRGEKTVEELLTRRRRPFEMEQPVRGFRVEEAPLAEYTLLDVEAPNENGIVFRLARLFTGLGWNILAARVSAWAGNARLAFYLTDAHGRPLDEAEVQARMLDAAESHQIRLV